MYLCIYIIYVYIYTVMPCVFVCVICNIQWGWAHLKNKRCITTGVCSIGCESSAERINDEINGKCEVYSQLRIPKKSLKKSGDNADQHVQSSAECDIAALLSRFSDNLCASLNIVAINTWYVSHSAPKAMGACACVRISASNFSSEKNKMRPFKTCLI